MAFEITKLTYLLTTIMM